MKPVLRLVDSGEDNRDSDPGLAPNSPTTLDSKGGGSDGTGMEARVAALEADMKDVKASQHRTETSLARIEAQLAAVLPTLATKADLATNNGRIDALIQQVSAQGTRLDKLERAVDDTIKAAIGKAVGPWQVPGILGACVVLIGALIAGLAWTMRHFGLSLVP